MKLLNIDDVVSMTSLSKHFWYKYTSQKLVPYYKIGNRILFDENQIVKFLEEHKVSPIDSHSGGC